MSNKLCPECNSTIGANATYCGCGWGRKKKFDHGVPDEPRAPCAHESCGRLSTVKIHTPTGWANLCLPHYQDHFLIAGTRKCVQLGLNTVAEKRKWVLDHMPDFRIRRPEREPGEDREELVA